MKIVKKHIENIIAFSTLISIFTLLRFSFFGLGEIIILLLFLTVAFKPIKKKIARDFIFSKFWLMFIIVSIIGFFIESLYFEGAHSSVESIIFDLAAYVFILIACFTLERMFFYGKIDGEKLLKSTFWISSLSIMSLYLVSKYTSSLFGLPLLYHNYFSPFADNIHQTSSFLMPLPLLAITIFNIERNKIYRILSLATIPILVAMTIETGSTKAQMGIIIGFTIFLSLTIANILGRKRLYYILAAYLLIALSLSGIIDYVGYANRFFMENDGGGARNILYTKGLTLGLQSPIFGYGPGSHIVFYGLEEKLYDAHQTLLTIFLQSGLIGLTLFTLLFFKVFAKVVYHPALFGALSAIMVYALGGDIMRRFPLWVLILVIFYIAQEYNTNQKNNKRI